MARALVVGLCAIGLGTALVRVVQGGLRRRRGEPPLPNRDEKFRWVRLGFAVLFGVETGVFLANGSTIIAVLNLAACVGSLVLSASGFRSSIPQGSGSREF